MWPLFKVEIDYNVKRILIFGAFIPLFCFYELLVIGTREGYTLLITYGLMVLWISFRNKEKRGLQHARLPLSIKQLALMRLILVLLFSFGFSILYYLTYYLFNFRGPAQPEKLIIYGCIILFKQTGEVPILLRYLDYINLLFEPPVNHREMSIFFISSLGLANFTVFTFRWRKSYLQ